MVIPIEIAIGGDALAAVESASLACGRLWATVDSSRPAASHVLLARHSTRDFDVQADRLAAVLLGEVAVDPADAGPTAAASAAAEVGKGSTGRGPRSSAVLNAAMAAGAICAAAPASRDAQRAAALESANLLAQGGALAAPWVAPWELDAAARAAAVQVDRSGEWTEWVRSWCLLLAREAGAAERSLRRATERMARESADVAAQHRVGVTAAAVVAHLHEHRTFTIRHAATALGLTRPTVGTAIERLEESGLATELTGQLRDRVWISSAWLELITTR